MKKKRLGEVLRERGHISHAELTKVIEDQQGKLIHLGELMLQRGLVAKTELAAALTEVTHVPYVDCEQLEIDPEILKLLPYPIARRCCVLPIHAQGTKLVVAMAEPQNLQIIDELRFSTGMDIIPRLAFRTEIEAAVEKWYGQVEEAEAAVADAIAPESEDPGMEFISSSSLQRNIEAMQEMQAELLQKSTPAVRMVASTITAAATKQASDIHIEPQATDTVIRLRVDGMLRDFQRIPRSLQNSVVSRIKILADMDIAERRAPQDGRFMVKITGRKVDLRVSTLPTQYGEKVVMRLLEANAPLQSFTTLGLPPEIAGALTQILAQPQGMLLVTGPTGSGKSTTLYSSLNLARKPTVNIITVEDPVEYAVPGLNQVQVNTKAGLTFASCLRSILRQDPNVIMVGEIRDKETAEIAIKAAQTGHLVLSTLHTNDSISAVTRLLDLGIPGFQIATSVTGVIAQRLVRRLCSCHDEIPATPEYVSRLLQAGVQNPPPMQHVPTGCDICDLTGYKGRVGIYEMLVIDEAIRSAVRSGGRNEEIRTLARHNGMKLMQEYALERVLHGQTTLDEVMRVVPFEKIHTTQCAACQHELSPTFVFCPYCGEKRTDGEFRKNGSHALVGQGARLE
ncbi:MAG TPA: ATPase, T2SS/T4P/T4SS family [Candidatus Acidoferrales bacterium]|nr:ATPase, T2SS/T4P/T4SS family [Candidatus Acidoferrales bacterium]